MKLVLICRRAFCPMLASMRSYGRVMFSDRFLVYTNTGLSVGLSVAGDLLQQRYQSTKKHSNSGTNVQWDSSRTTKMAASGLVVGPFIHYWYKIVEKWFPGRHWRILLKKLAVDQLLGSPAYIVLFLVTIGIMDGQGWQLLKEEFKDTGVIMYLTEFTVWTPVQALNFSYVPTRYRVLFDSGVSLAVDTFFSYLRFDRDLPQHSKPGSDGEESESHHIQPQIATHLNKNQNNSSSNKQISSLQCSTAPLTFAESYKEHL